MQSVEYATRPQTGPPRDFDVYLRTIGGSDYKLASAIVTAESNWHPEAHNKSSTASGLAQYLDSTFQSQCIDHYSLADSLAQKNDPYIQMTCLVAMLHDGGSHHWDASRSSWEYVLK